jgi:hypothetical protein
MLSLQGDQKLVMGQLYWPLPWDQPPAASCAINLAETPYVMPPGARPQQIMGQLYCPTRLLGSCTALLHPGAILRCPCWCHVNLQATSSLLSLSH